MILIPRGYDLIFQSARPALGPAWEPVDRTSGIYSEEHGEDLHGTLAHVRCPMGHVLRVSHKFHSIAADGTLSPSWVCVIPGCTWHESVRLDGWVAP